MIRPKPRYTVVYAPELENGIAEFWLTAGPADRRRMTRVIDYIDYVLAMTPEMQGRPLEPDGDLTVWEIRDFPPPVRVTYQLAVEDRLVSVVGITFFNDDSS